MFRKPAKSGKCTERDYDLAQEARLGREDRVRQLLMEGADINAMDGMALRYATMHGDWKIVKLALESGAKTAAKDYDALITAALLGNDKIVRIIFWAHSANHEPTNRKWKRALDTAWSRAMCHGKTSTAAIIQKVIDNDGNVPRVLAAPPTSAP